MAHFLDGDTFGNPFERKKDFFETKGYKLMAIDVLRINLMDLICDPDKGRSGPEREEMAQAKAEAGPWFKTPSFEAYAWVIAPAETIERFRERCLEEPEAVLQQLHQMRRLIEEGEGHLARQVRRQAAAHLPANAWPFEPVAPLAAT